MPISRGFALRPDAQAFDEVRIVTVPRYKTSGLSGDEWRISARVELIRKGKVVHTESYRNVEVAARFLAFAWAQACDYGKAYYAGIEGFCDQEGCAEPPTVTLRKKEEFATENPREWHRPAPEYSSIRRFCARHARRGNAGFDDSDLNYEVISGEPAPNAKDERPATFGGVIDLSEPGSYNKSG